MKLLKDHYFLAFKIESNSHFELPIEIQLDTDWIFYAVCFFMIMIMMSFGIWYRRNISSLFSNHIKEPLELLANSLKNGTNLTNQKNAFIEEVQYLQNQINLWQQQQENSQEKEKTIALGMLAAQVAHDIRSPLVVLDILVKDLPNLSEQHRNLIRHSISRIHGIADDLIITYKSDGKKSYKELKVNIAIALQIESIVFEKRVQYQKRNIFFNLHAENCYQYFCSVETTEFKRMISNLINNTVEADATKIDISLKKEIGFLKIIIADNGRGIPKDVLKTLNNLADKNKDKPFCGLGLSHAFSCIQSWGGRIHIDSQLGVGTTLEILLPIITPPIWFVEQIDLVANTHVVIVDDEMFIHELWNKRLKDLVERKKITINHLYSLASLKEFLEQQTLHHFLFLVDLEFPQEQKLGCQFIAEYNLSAQAMLVTNKFDAPEIIAQCEKLNIKIIPKRFAPYIPITLKKTLKEELSC